MVEIDLLEIRRGHVSAPAGYGKTQLIADSLSRHEGDKPVLILTHTNAGVASLKIRLREAGVPSSAFSLKTIDGWAMMLLSCYPKRAVFDTKHLLIKTPGRDYPQIQNCALRLVREHHIDELLQRTYSRVVIDEYQDCSVDQHAMVVALAVLLPCVVLGDELQSVFQFGNRRVVPWNEVCSEFEQAHELTTPWRWNNVGADEIGKWFVGVRRALLDGTPIDLNDLPDGVEYRMTPDPQRLRQDTSSALRDLASDGSVLIIGSKTNVASREKFAQSTPGVSVVEPVELRTLIGFAGCIDLKDPIAAIHATAELARSVMTGVENAVEFRKRIEKIIAGNRRMTVRPLDAAAVAVVRAPLYIHLAELLEAFRHNGDTRLFRPTIYDASLNTLKSASRSEKNSVQTAARSERDRRRHIERTMPPMAIGKVGS